MSNELSIRRAPTAPRVLAENSCTPLGQSTAQSLTPVWQQIRRQDDESGRGTDAASPSVHSIAAPLVGTSAATGEHVGRDVDPGHCPTSERPDPTRIDRVLSDGADQSASISASKLAY